MTAGGRASGRGRGRIPFTCSPAMYFGTRLGHWIRVDNDEPGEGLAGATSADQVQRPAGATASARVHLRRVANRRLSKAMTIRPNEAPASLFLSVVNDDDDGDAAAGQGGVQAFACEMATPFRRRRSQTAAPTGGTATGEPG
jgi:hypothetical protein